MKPASYDKEHILEYIQKYFPSNVLTMLCQKANERGLIKSKEMEIAILFADIRGSTALSETVAPEQLTQMLNIYFTAMDAIIAAHHGMIIDFIGDEILVAFGAPEKSDTAQIDSVRCAIEMQEEVKQVNALFTELAYPTIEIGIGIHYGKVFTGSIGTPTRLKYDLIGKNVNITARIQAQAAGGQILLTDVVKHALDTEIHTSMPRTITAKGIEQPITVYEVIWQTKETRAK